LWKRGNSTGLKLFDVMRCAKNNERQDPGSPALALLLAVFSAIAIVQKVNLHSQISSRSDEADAGKRFPGTRGFGVFDCPRRYADGFI